MKNIFCCFKVKLKCIFSILYIASSLDSNIKLRKLSPCICYIKAIKIICYLFCYVLFMNVQKVIFLEVSKTVFKKKFETSFSNKL